MTPRLSRLESVEALERAMERLDAEYHRQFATREAATNQTVLFELADRLGLDLDHRTVTDLFRAKAERQGETLAPHLASAPLEKAIGAVFVVNVFEGLLLGLLLTAELDGAR